MVQGLDGRWLHDKDGMTPARADAMVAEVTQAKQEMQAAFLAGALAKLAELQLKCDNINKEARRLNVIRQQRIEGYMGRKPAGWDDRNGE